MVRSLSILPNLADTSIIVLRSTVHISVIDIDIGTGRERGRAANRDFVGPSGQRGPISRLITKQNRRTNQRATRARKLALLKIRIN